MNLRLVTAVISFSIASGPVWAQPDLSGIWMLSSFAKEGELAMTEEALTIQAAYDLLTDDPSLYCEPASISRVWANPNVRITFEQSPVELQINYEFYDLRRTIPIGDENAMSLDPSTVNVSGTAFDKMGSSFARYEDEKLIIETRNHAPGYIRTSRGVPQSAQTVSIEELWIEGGRLLLRQTYVDDTLFEIPFVLEYGFERIQETELPLYECTDANYDWFEKLNAPNEEEQR